MMDTWLGLIFTVIVAAGQEQRIVTHPQDIRVLRGARALLKCKVANQHGAVLWAKNGFGLGSDRALAAYDRYSMVGSSADGEYHLNISNVQLEDDASYFCQLLATEAQPPAKSDVAQLTVMVKPSPPRLMDGEENLDVLEGQENLEMAINCVSEGGKPRASMNWVIAERSDGTGVVRSLGAKKSPNQTLSSGIATETHIEVDKLFTVRSHLRFKPNKKYHGKYLVCLASHPTIDGAMFASALISLRYAPRASISLNSSAPLEEGKLYELTCTIDANPSQGVTYEWRQDGKFRASNSYGLLTLALGRSDHGSVIECAARNDVGIGVDTYEIRLNYKPEIVHISDVVAVDEGGSVVLSCLADSNPSAAIEWTKVGQPNNVLHKGENFTISQIYSQQQGGYQCKAIAKGFPPVAKHTSVYINGPPKVVLPTIVEVSSGSMIDLTCKVHGFPRSTDVFWYRGKQQIVDGSEEPKRYEIRDLNPEDGYQDGIVSILRINGVESADFGLFNCSARNGRGFNSALVRLVPIDTLPMYLLIPGVIAGCVVLLLLALCVIVLNRKTCCGDEKAAARRGYDEHSDVQVKVEALDGRGYPDMYSTYTTTAPDHPDIVYGKDYMAVPQDNPDLDLLPPPYTHGPPIYANGHSNGAGFQPGPQGLVQMTYLDDRCPPSSHLIYPEVTYQSFVPHTDPIYYPSLSAAPLACLEPVQEVPTPETEQGTPLLMAQQHKAMHNGLSRDYSSSEHERSASRGSTHV